MQNELNKLKEMLIGKTVTVIGIGVSNTPLIKMLAGMGITVTARDKNNNLGDIKGELEELGVKLFLGDDYLENITEDVVFKTPGLRFDMPQLLNAKKNGSIITSEMELFYKLCPAKKIAVTGSDGKTTTTTLIYEMLKKQGYTCHLGGNIGAPLLDRIGEVAESDIVVTELSSFQLHTMTTSPQIAVVTNLAPNHLDMHKSMDEYIEAKENIFKHQSEDDVLIANLDNEITNNISKKAPSSVRYFSRQSKPEKGVWLDRDKIMTNLSGVEEFILDSKDIRLPGIHNVENYMTAIAAVWGMVDIDTINYIAKNFGGVEHRIEFVREKNGVKYYNDSIASSPSRARAGLYSFDHKIILIAGGYDKHIPFDDFGYDIVERVKALYLAGHTANKIEQAVKNAQKATGKTVPVIKCESMEQATILAAKDAKAGDVVMLSPACASFDAFKNFAERGNKFKEIVKGL